MEPCPIPALNALAAYIALMEAKDTALADITTSYAALREAFSQITQADGAMVEAAQARHADGSDDEIEVDDGALTSCADEGTWVMAWVWVPAPEDDESEEG